MAKATKTKDEQFIEDLFGYMAWCANNNVNPCDTLANIAHDLASWRKDRHEPWWSPRTAGYAKHIKP